MEAILLNTSSPSHRSNVELVSSGALCIHWHDLDNLCIWDTISKASNKVSLNANSRKELEAFLRSLRTYTSTSMYLQKLAAYVGHSQSRRCHANMIISPYLCLIFGPHMASSVLGRLECHCVGGL